MKWTRRGHEFDEIYRNMAGKKRFYLFGAGDYGRMFFERFGGEIALAGVIDGEPGKRLGEYKCIPLSEAELGEDTGVIVTMSQIARISAKEELERRLGKGRENRDYFMIEDFLSVYFVYRYGKVYFTNISFLPSTACNLNCRCCLNFNPFAKKFYTRDIRELLRDVDLFFSRVDYVMLFHISGGEPLLYRELPELIRHIGSRYGDRIGRLRTVTNGTQLPSEACLKAMRQYGVEVTVDDYREAVPEYRETFDNLCRMFEEQGVRFYVNKAEEWLDLAPERTDYSGWSEEQMIAHRDACSQCWQELRGGKLYNCNYASYAAVAGILREGDRDWDAFDLAADGGKKKELVEFRLGYTEKGYTSFCRQCRGFTSQNCARVAPAEQVKKEGGERGWIGSA